MISSVISSPGGAIQEIRHFLSPEVVEVFESLTTRF
jgi:hypothetical protein